MALLTRPVLVYLIGPALSAGGVISREDPRWGLLVVNVGRPVESALLGSGRPGVVLVVRSDVRRRLVL